MTDLVHRVTFGRSKKPNFPSFKQGDTINVHVKVKEGSKERVQVFKGVVIKLQGKAMGRSFTVRKISSGIGVERTFPFVSPAIEKIDLLSRGKVRRSKLFFLRGLSGRKARIDSELVVAEGGGVGAADELSAEKAPVEEAVASPQEVSKEAKTQSQESLAKTSDSEELKNKASVPSDKKNS